jgi:hypothetical protein
VMLATAPHLARAKRIALLPQEAATLRSSCARACSPAITSPGGGSLQRRRRSISPTTFTERRCGDSSISGLRIRTAWSMRYACPSPMPETPPVAAPSSTRGRAFTWSGAQTGRLCSMPAGNARASRSACSSMPPARH